MSEPDEEQAEAADFLDFARTFCKKRPIYDNGNFGSSVEPETSVNAFSLWSCNCPTCATYNAKPPKKKGLK